MRSPNPSNVHFVRAMGPIAREILGEPNSRLSSKNELRFGTNGSLSVDLVKGVWFNNDPTAGSKPGGGVLDFLRVRLGLVNGAALEHLRERGLLPDSQRPQPNAKPRITATHPYTNADGELLFEVIRKEPKTFLQRRPDGKGGWIWKLGDIKRVPYRLPELLEAISSGETIFVAEGEKDVDALRRLGLAATCNSGGAGKWTAEHNEWLHNADVVVVGDNDEPGRKHAADVAIKLWGFARRVRVLELPDLPDKGDVSDWLARGGTAEQLEELARHAREPTSDSINEPAPTAPLPLLWFDDIKPVLDARDFVQGTLTEGGAAVVYGESNSGKTFWTTDLALHVAAGKDWNDRRVDQGGVIYCALEGGHGFRNRVAAWRQTHAPKGGLPFAAIPSAINLLDPEADTQRLIDSIRAAQAHIKRPVRLVVIDTLSRAMAGGNENAPDDMGALVMNMDRIRTETGACILFVHHSGKDAAKGARGHSSLRAAIDTELEVVSDEETGARSAAVVKQRDMAKGAVFGFRLEQLALGHNQHGEEVTTCVVESQEAAIPATHSKAKHLTVTERGWFSDLQAMFADRFEPQRRVTHPGQPEQVTLTRDQVRDGFRRRGRLGNGEVTEKLSNAERQQLHKMLTALKDKGKIDLTNKLVWLQ